MKRAAVIIGLMLLLSSCVTRAGGAGTHEVGVVPPDGAEMQDKSKEAACDCCQKCKAAKATMETHKEEGALEGNGCEDCCTRCGKELQPRSQEAPPEVIEHGVRPELQHK